MMATQEGAMDTVVVRQGDEVGLTVTEQARERLGLQVGQELVIEELADGWKLTRPLSKLERQLQVVDEVLREQAGVLRALASR